MAKYKAARQTSKTNPLDHPPKKKWKTIKAEIIMNNALFDASILKQIRGGNSVHLSSLIPVLLSKVCAIIGGNKS